MRKNQRRETLAYFLAKYTETFIFIILKRATFCSGRGRKSSVRISLTKTYLWSELKLIALFVPPTSHFRILCFLLTFFLSNYCGKKKVVKPWKMLEIEVTFSSVSAIFWETFGFLLRWTVFSIDAKLVFSHLLQHIWRQKLFPGVSLRKGWWLKCAPSFFLFFFSDVL